MDGPGTITWEEFLEDAERFLFVSDRISDGWELRGDKVQLYVILYIEFLTPVSNVKYANWMVLIYIVNVSFVITHRVVDCKYTKYIS